MTQFDESSNLDPSFAAIAATSDGDNTVVAAVAGAKIRVLSYVIVGNADGTFIWNSDLATGTQTALSGTIPINNDTGVTADFTPLGHFETVAGKALVLTMSAGADALGHLCYVEI